jgi:uncharacterized Ntn-hydrolase superfamily protein
VTFSIAARDPATGALGVAITSSSICVASRCAFVRTGTGAALTQNVTDPRLGPRALELMADGLPARDALARLRDEAAHIAWRQLAAVDRDGRTAHFSGARALGIHGAAEGAGCVAIGNLLANPGIPRAMVEAFENASDSLGARLVGALEAGLAAGGETSPVRSAGLLVADRQPWPVADLRVDWADQPIAALRALWTEYAPQLEAYVTRALDPEAAPSFDSPAAR